MIEKMNDSEKVLARFGVERFEKRLDNGVNVILFRKVGAPIAATAVLRSGGRFDPSNMPGVAHFLEHMIVNGSDKFPSKDLLAEHIQSVGGSFGAWTSDDLMAVNTEVAEESDFQRAIDIFEACLCSPRLDKKVFENEKNVIKKEIQRSNSNTTRLLYKTCRPLFFKNTLIEHTVLGTEEDISSLRYEDVLSMHQILFDASRITFIASGDITIDTLIKGLNTLKLLQDTTQNLQEVMSIPTKSNNIMATFHDVPQTHIALGVQGPKMMSRDMLLLNVLGSILAGGRSARLTKRLRYEKGLVYSVSYTLLGSVDLGAWTITTDTASSLVQEVVHEILMEIDLLHENGVTESELEFIKSRRIKSLKSSMQTSTSWIGFHSTGESLSPTMYYDIPKYINEISNITIQDINGVIEKYLGKENWKLALVGRTRAEDISIM